MRQSVGADWRLLGSTVGGERGAIRLSVENIHAFLRSSRRFLFLVQRQKIGTGVALGCASVSSGRHLNDFHWGVLSTPPRRVSSPWKAGNDVGEVCFGQ